MPPVRFLTRHSTFSCALNRRDLRLRFASQCICTLSRALPLKLDFARIVHSNFRVFPFGVYQSANRAYQECIRGKHTRAGPTISKSLIEDEDDLSDWVGSLNQSSHSGRSTSDDETEYLSGRNTRDDRYRRRESNFDKRGYFGRGTVTEDFSMKRGRERSGGSGRWNAKNGSAVAKFSRSTSSENARNDGKCKPKMKSVGKSGRGTGAQLGKAASKQIFENDEGEDEYATGASDEEDGLDSEKEEMISNLGEFLNEETGDEDGEEEDAHVVAKEDFLSVKKGNSLKVDSSMDASSYLSETRFDECQISPLSLKAIKDAGYENMTMVQAATLPAILKGKDVLAKAKTGTGKTIAFLLPSIEVILKSSPVDHDNRRPPILVLVICPTRELASQAAKEADRLLKYHSSIGVQVVIGGTRLTLEQKRMATGPCQILVATPGRLKDHIENTAGFATKLKSVKVLVLDEADRLLDMGFRRDIDHIIAALPKQRQTLLFSATVPDEVRQMCHVALRKDHDFINTVQAGSEETNSQVKQMYTIAPLDKQFPLLYVRLKDHITDNIDYKVIVFCTTARMTSLVAEILGELKLNVREIHSRKNQAYRTRVSDEFRKSKGLILVTSDVSARGVDYPDVTLVIQVGVPADREQYIHRLGRTGRKGKEGEGLLILAPWEEFFLSSVKQLPISKVPPPTVDIDANKQVLRALSRVKIKSKEAAYQAWLGYYNSNKGVGKDKCRLVELANEFSRSMGMDIPPTLQKNIVSKMGLRNVPGLRVQ